MKSIACLLATLAFALAIPLAQAADNKELIVGKWRLDSDKMKLEIVMDFSKDGDLKTTVSSGGKQLDLGGKYKFLDDKTLEVTITAPDKKTEPTIEKMTIKSLSSDTMVIADSSGLEQTFKRAK
jgi:uncharacterized protein (TIGR03066 family)